jgi:hypothetical protein
MKIALFLFSFFWVVSAPAQTTVTAVGAPNSEYRRLSVTIDRNGDFWDFTTLRTEAGYQGIVGARICIELINSEHGKLAVSPGFYGVFGDRPELFGSGLGLGWDGEWQRLQTEGLIIQYINPIRSSFYRYTIGEGEVLFRLKQGLYATGGGEKVHNSPEAEKKISWGGGLAYKKGKWKLFAQSRGQEAQLGLTWSPSKKEHH